MKDPWNAEVVWRPDVDARAHTRLGHYMDWLAAAGGPDTATYDELWQWSVEQPGAFWTSIRDHFALPFTGERTALDRGAASPTGLPGASWFPGATGNYVQAVHAASPPGDAPALIAHSQTRPPRTLSRAELWQEVARVRRGLHALGVGRGDRVAAYAPNVPETIVTFLATASLGAIWSSCAPEFGTRSVLDRLSQIRPTVLLAIDGYRYGTRVVDRRDEVAAIRGALADSPTLVHLGYLDPDAAGPQDAVRYEELDGSEDPGIIDVDFADPLYVLYSSGTTGLPKAIVHGHGGITLEHVKALALHNDLGPSDRFFWFSTTGWMMWNYLVSGLAVGSALVLFDGDPGADELHALWALAETTAATGFGVSAPFLDACRHAGLEPARDHDLTHIRWVGSTGAPLVAEAHRWITRSVGPVQIGSISGGTDVCTAFVGPAPIRETRAGIIPCRFLGAHVLALDASGKPVVGTEGELVVATPMPSMPVGLWNDPDGSRLAAAYFERVPDHWHHGDWITIAPDGSCVISGRSDATLNRGGVRLGTAEFYAVVEAFAEVADSLVVHLEAGGTHNGELVAFVAMAPGVDLDDELGARLRGALRSQLSPRHVPDRIVAVPAIPRTLSGKKLEVPVKRILQGTPPDEALTRGALADPSAIDAFVSLAKTPESSSPEP